MERPPTVSAPSLSPWQPLNYADVVHAPDAFGVTVVADAKHEPLLVSPGVIRDELWRLVNDPLAKAHGAAYFRFYLTTMSAEAEHLANSLVEESDHGPGRRLYWRYFPAPG